MMDSINILLVDDDDVDRMAVRRTLQKSGLNFDLTEAVDGAGALQACRDRQFDCVFLDYRLPDRDGADIFRAMVNDHGSKAAVIFLTGEEDEVLALELMASGVVDYLTKKEISVPVIRRAVRYATARQNFVKQLSELAQIDTLTGLPNRSVFPGVLSKAVNQAKRAQDIVCIALLDLDHFKIINDTMGHPAGDELLKMASERLLATTRETDTVLRLGGDEFVIVAPNLKDAAGAAVLAQKVVDQLSAPFCINGHELFVSTSIGLALAPIDGTDPAELLKSADLALYKAKADGRSRFRFFDEEMNTAAQRQHELIVRIRQALSNEEFELYYQPKWDIPTGVIQGAECLIRWNHPKRGIISPADFIPIAEKYQLIVEIGDWVLQEACAQNMAWQRAGMPPLNCSVNLSPLQLKDAGLIVSIDKAIETSGFDPSFLEVEITESAILGNVEHVAALLRLLQQRGISVSIDDFGTGYSSLTHLKELPVDKLKIDQSFVSNIMTNNGDAEITSAIISLANKLGMETIAEGVEDKLQLDFLSGEGCNQAQGYYLSRPLPANEFFDMYKKYNEAPQFPGTKMLLSQ